MLTHSFIGYSVKTHLGRRPFTNMEIHTLFKGYIYGDHKMPREQAKHWHFWLPLISYYTGTFSDEIGQLTLDNVTKQDGHYFFDFHTNNKIKPRRIPVHPMLIEHGFLDYLHFLKQQGQQRLMFDLPAKSGRYSEKVRIWFSGEGERAGYLQKCHIPNIDLDGRKAAISSFRLNFEAQIRISSIQAGSKDAFNYLMGFKDYAHSEFENSKLLWQITRGVRALPGSISWQRFCDRH